MSSNETLGIYLRRERELRQVPLIGIAASTRIPLNYLNALEKDDFSDLPAKTFVRGYLKAYARHIGIDESDLLLRFDQTLENHDEPREESRAKRLAPIQARRRHPYLLLLLGLGIALAVAFYLSKS